MMNNNQNMNILQRFNELRQNYRGNPQDDIKRMLQSGRMTQGQLNMLQEMAQQFSRLIK